MATRTETIYTHTCDLCGTERDKDELRHLSGDERAQDIYNPGRARIDICGQCLSRPVSDVLEFLDRARADAEARRNRRTVVKP
jgi:hypothetical protein